MILSAKSLFPNSYKIFFKVVKNPCNTKNICKEILRKYRSSQNGNTNSSANETAFSYSYTSNMISFAVCDRSLANEIFDSLKRPYLLNKMYSKSALINGAHLKQYLIRSELTHPISLQEDFLRKVALEIYKKTGYVASSENGLIAITINDPNEISRVVDKVLQGGRVAIRMSGQKRMLTNKGEIEKVGKILFSNYQGRNLFDKCIEKNNHVFILLNNEILYDLRMMFRLDKVKNNILYLECDGVVYGSLVLNEKNLMRPEILLASFSDDNSSQKFMRKLKYPLPQLELHHTSIVKTEENLKLWILGFVLALIVFLSLSRKRKKMAILLITSLLFSFLIYSKQIGFLHLKILSIAIIFNLLISTIRGLKTFLYNTLLVITCMLCKHFLAENLVLNIFFSSLAQLLMYQSLINFSYTFDTKLFV